MDPGEWILVSGSWWVDPGVVDPGGWILVSGSWWVDPGGWILVGGSWWVDLAGAIYLYLDPPCARILPRTDPSHILAGEWSWLLH